MVRCGRVIPVPSPLRSKRRSMLAPRCICSSDGGCCCNTAVEYGAKFRDDIDRDIDVDKEGEGDCGLTGAGV